MSSSFFANLLNYLHDYISSDSPNEIFILKSELQIVGSTNHFEKNIIRSVKVKAEDTANEESIKRVFKELYIKSFEIINGLPDIKMNQCLLYSGFKAGVKPMSAEFGTIPFPFKIHGEDGIIPVLFDGLFQYTGASDYAFSLSFKYTPLV